VIIYMDHCVIRMLLESCFKPKSPYEKAHWTYRAFSSVRLRTQGVTYSHVCFGQRIAPFNAEIEILYDCLWHKWCPFEDCFL
jgi:hypothetical protein